ncbi:MAG: HIT family protein [Phycisphaerae bacterium]
MNSEPNSSTERSRNLWAPWRMEYIDSLTGPPTEGGCFLCAYRDRPEKDRENLVLWRGSRTLTVMNRFPYTGGHALVAPLEHQGQMDALEPQTLLELITVVRDVQTVMSEAIEAKGFNVGINVGRCAGAGLPGHLHIHVVPRWPGDTNFMTALGGIRVIPQALSALYEQLRQAGQKLSLPVACREQPET